MKLKGNADIAALLVLLLGLGFVQFVRGLPLVRLAMQVGAPAALRTVGWNAATCAFGHRSQWNAAEQARVAQQLKKVQDQMQRIQAQQQKRVWRLAEQQRKAALQMASTQVREQLSASMEQIRQQQVQQLEMLRRLPHDFATQR